MHVDIYDEWRQQRTTIAHFTHEKISDVNLMAYIHLENFHIIQNELNKFGAIDAIIMQREDSDRFKKIHLNITRLLFNYISSAISLKEATRNLLRINELKSDNLIQESSKIIQDKILINPTIKFIEELRNVITHQSMLPPSIAHYFKLDPLKIIHGYAYISEKLIENKRFSNQTKEYIKKENDKYVFLLPLIEKYHSITSSYQYWLIEKTHSTHREKYPDYWRSRESIMSDWGNDEPLISERNIKPYLTL